MLQLFAGRALAPLLGPALLIAGGFAAAEAYEHKVPWGLMHKLEAVRLDLGAWRAAQIETAKVATSWAASAGKSEALRRTEQGAAIGAVNQVQAQCADRVAKARASARAIQAIVNREVPTDAQGCPIRQFVDARELRDAIAPRP